MDQFYFFFGQSFSYRSAAGGALYVGVLEPNSVDYLTKAAKQ
jgi:hypothetical protein